MVWDEMYLQCQDLFALHTL